MNIFGDPYNDDGGDDGDPGVSHPDDGDSNPGATEYPGIGEPGEGDIYVPSNVPDSGGDVPDCGGDVWGI